MVATLQSRKDALEAKIAEKTAELKRLCLEEADLTGILPPETPLEPGEPLPTIRRRVGTSFSYPQNLLNYINGTDDASLGALELQCKIQSSIADAALAIANDASEKKTVRRKHRLMYQQSQGRLSELTHRLKLLKQGKHQPIKPQQIKKKPRPNTTTVDHAMLMREFLGDKQNGYYSNTVGAWPPKPGHDLYNEDDIRQFSSLHRPSRSSGTSHSSNSPCLSARELSAVNSLGLPDHFTITSSLSQPNIQDLKPLVPDFNSELRRSDRRSSERRQWDSQSAGGTLLPNQTYPDSHQPNLNRTQSLGSVDGQRQNKEKEWYETALDSAPSPPLRTTSRLPSARVLYHMQELQIRDAVQKSLNHQQRQHPSLTRTHRATPVDEMTAVLQDMRVTASPRMDQRSEDTISLSKRVEIFPRSEQRHLDNNEIIERSRHNEQRLHDMTPVQPEQSKFLKQAVNHRHYTEQPASNRLLQEIPNNREYFDSRPPIERPRHLEFRQTPELPNSNIIPPSKNAPNHNQLDPIRMKEPINPSGAVYIEIPEDVVDAVHVPWRHNDGVKTPTQPYFHTGAGWISSVPGLPEVHPPHAVTQEEITFDTVVPFESPQNHTVVQAGIWQPYREVTKPFEMSDFYKYSTKFRQARQSPGQQQQQNTPEPSRKSPGGQLTQPIGSSQHQSNTLVGVYQPLRPMTCQPVERRANPTQSYSELSPTSSVSTPKIV